MGRKALSALARGVGRSLLRSLALTPLTLATGAGASPQSVSPPQVQAQETTPQFRIRAERNLVVVAVVVRDAKGRTVGDLHKEDFRLFDGGQPKEFTGFAVEVSNPKPEAAQAQSAPAVPANAPAVAPLPPATAAPQHFIALFFDDLHGKPEEFWRSRDAAWRYLSTTVRPQDHVAILTSTGKNQVDFTGDQAKLHQALFRLSPRTHRSTGCPEIDDYEAYLIDKGPAGDALAVVHEEAIQCDCGTGSTTFDATTERPATMQHREAGGDSCSTVAMRDAESKAAAIWSYAENQSRNSLQALANSVSHLAAMPGQRSLVLVSSGFLTETEGDKVDAIINRALQQEVVISAIYAPGLEAPLPEETMNPVLPPAFEARKSVLKSMGSAVSASVLASLSSGTGGVFFYNNNDFDEGFRRAEAAPEVLYVLSFSPQDVELDGKFHSLKVTLTTHEPFTIQARRGYLASKTALGGAADKRR